MIKRIVAWVLRRLGLSVLGAGGWVAVAAIAAVISLGSLWSGYKLASTVNNARQAAELRQAIAAKEAAERRADAEAKRYLAASQKRRVVYREVIKRVPQYIDTGDCRLTDDGLRAVNCAIDPAKCSAGADPAMPGPAAPGKS